MKKIGNKLLSTYFIILIIVFLISIISFHFVSKRYLIDEARIQLKVEGEKIAELLKREKLDNVDLRTKINTKIQLKLANRFIDSQMVVINKNRELIYFDIKDLDKKDILNILLKDKPVSNGYVTYKTPILDNKNNFKGYVFMLTKLNNINTLNKLNRQAQIISILIGSVLAFITAIFLKEVSLHL